MTFRLSKRFTLESAHFLPNVPTDHKCRRMHGHSFRVEIFVESERLTDVGWVLDFADIASAFAPIHQELDHRVLNEVPGLENPTSEVLARWIFQRLKDVLPGLAGVKVHETCTSSALYWAPS